jgi:hypothetical protein
MSEVKDFLFHFEAIPKSSPYPFKLMILCPAGLHTTFTRLMGIFQTYLFSRVILNSAGQYVTNYP